MSVPLFITDNFSLTAQGSVILGKQGGATSGWTDPYGLPVTGLAKEFVGSLGTAAVVTLFSSADALQAWTYFWFWADQPVDLQLIGTGSNVIVPVAALVPFKMSGNTLLAAANTTPITGGSTPSLTTIATVILGNYSGQTANYRGAFIG